MPSARSRRQQREAKRLLESGSRLLRSGQLDLAIKKLQRAADLMPDNLTVRVNLGTAYYTEGRTARAADQFREAVRLDPGNATVLLNLAAALNGMGETQEAIETLERTLQINPEHPDCHYNLAVAYLATGDRERGIEELGKEFEVNPNSRNAIQLLHQLSGDPDAKPVSERLAVSDRTPAAGRRQAGWRTWLFWLAAMATALLVAYLLKRGI